MSKFTRYILNPETLLYESESVPRKTRILHVMSGLLFGIALSVLYFWIYIAVFELEPPKTAFLKKANDFWSSKIDLMNLRMDKYESVLDGLEMRNDDVYRSIFGMDRISQELLNSGFGGVDRYDFLDGISKGSNLKEAYMRMDRLTKETYVQSMAFEEVASLSKRAGDMASCVPAIPPLYPKPGSYSLSSHFGYRIDPIHNYQRYHSGVDFSARKGTPIYATGDGVVEEVKFMFNGYGRYVVINHGFGYKTMYAHMNDISVVEGMKVKRGQSIGSVGSTGRSTGSHLHYEVTYRGGRVNPANFYDLNMSVKEYEELTEGIEQVSVGPPSNEFHFKSSNR